MIENNKFLLIPKSNYLFLSEKIEDYCAKYSYQKDHEEIGLSNKFLKISFYKYNNNLSWGAVNTNKKIEFEDQSNDEIISLKENSIEIVISYFQYSGVFFDEHYKSFSNDFRLLFFIAELNLDPIGIAGFFQYASQVSPFTIAKGITKLSAGNKYNFSLENYKIVKEPFLNKINTNKSKTEDKGILNDFKYLEQYKEYNKIGIYYSGGVDSNFLLKNFLDVKDKVQLFNCSFGAGDKESVLAKNTAEYLGVKFHQFKFEPSYTNFFLDSIDKDYSEPFVDISTIPTHFLTQKTSEIFNQDPIFDGTGADGAHAMLANYNKWNKIHKLPYMVKYLFSFIYKSFSLYNISEINNSFSTLENIGRASKNSLQDQIYSSALKNNGLANIAYPYSQESSKRIRKSIEELVSIIGDNNGVSKISLTDMVLACNSCFIQKNYEPGLNRGIETIYPFMNHSTYAKSLRFSWDDKNIGSSKSILKKEVAEIIPDKWVYRKKSGFKPPLSKMFSNDFILSYFFDEILSNNNPLIDFIDLSKTNEILESQRKGKVISYSCYHYLTALLFLNTWIKQTKNL